MLDPETIASCRKEAKKTKNKFYFGKLCKNCGGIIRLASNANCYPCFLETTRDPKKRDYLKKYVRTEKGEKTRRESARRFRDIPKGDGEKPASTRTEAINKKSTTYFTGVPCVNGHFSKRITKTTQCIECKKKISEKFLQKKAEDIGRTRRNENG